jgi:hypothetical protein
VTIVTSVKSALSLGFFITILATERENGNAAMNAYQWFLLGMMVAFAQ